LKKILFGIVFLIILGSLLIGCGEPEATPTATPTKTPTAIPTASPTATTPTPTAGPKYGGTFTMILNASPAGNIGWPPEFMGGDSTTAQVCYEGLMREQANGSYTPCLATSWEMADDKLSATYQLRQGVTFHDGTPFNAESAKFNFDASIEAHRQPYWDHVEVIDDYTVKIYFTEYRNGIVYSPGTSWMASPTAAQKDGSLDYIRKNPCGTGPFKFVSFQQDQEFVVERNPNYWQEGLPYLDKLRFIFIPEPMTQKAAMQKGEADAMPAELGKLCADFRDLGFYVMTLHQAVFSLFFDSNMEGSNFKDERVRQAVEYAINRDEIAKGLGYGLMIPIHNIIAADNAAYTDDIPYRPYDPDKAKQLLAEAGYPNGFQTVMYPHVNGDKDINLYVKQCLDAVGIQTEIIYVPWTQNMQQMTGDFTGMLMGPFASLANFGSTLQLFLDRNSIFFPAVYKPDEYQAILDEIAHSDKYPDIELARKATRYIAEHAIIVPVHDGGMGYVIGSRIGNPDEAFLTLGYPPYFRSEIIWLKE
jgi:peptide/nickel transport system substrate-binding protein